MNARTLLSLVSLATLATACQSGSFKLPDSTEGEVGLSIGDDGSDDGNADGGSGTSNGTTNSDDGGSTGDGSSTGGSSGSGGSSDGGSTGGSSGGSGGSGGSTGGSSGGSTGGSSGGSTAAEVGGSFYFGIYDGRNTLCYNEWAVDGVEVSACPGCDIAFDINHTETYQGCGGYGDFSWSLGWPYAYGRYEMVMQEYRGSWYPYGWITDSSSSNLDWQVSWGPADYHGTSIYYFFLGYYDIY